ncbi:M1 family metallopeptidase [Actinokineospora sp. UTMC 2448]|uniref:M1 family metallopeptidase n=1 Tax=Actinokineospora sp. UTMC 2448 TaxID=2268449 RepID=UPI002164A4DA|nr:M1 family metallopeptidase [Actinokineospora sp. UTMC 2448]UVS76666.1 Aminopeptidase N [Actinokineospora sp. UTMC 2448]
MCAVAAAAAVTACTSAPEPQPRQPQPEAPATVDGVGADGIGDPYYPEDGNGGYDVTAYEVSVSYDPESRHLDGDTVVKATATAPMSRFNLDLTGLDVRSVEVDGAQAEHTREGDQELVITPATPLTPGQEFAVRVRYAGKPRSETNGPLGAGGWQISKSGGAYAAGEPHSASSWFPVNDHPRDKATFTLNARVPDGWSVVSNGVEEPAKAEGGWTTYRWVEPNRIATYLTTIGIDKWTFERSKLADGTPVVNAYAPGTEAKKAVQSRMPEVLAFLESRFGEYPQSAAGGIYLNENIAFSLETQGRPIYAKWAELDVVVHELAHQWWGNSVSVDSWADICLNECFASYASWMWDESQGADLDERYRTAVARGYERERFWNRKLYDMGAGNEFTAVYDKGQLALHALRKRVGEDAWNEILRTWLATHADGNASWEQFEDLVAKVAGEDVRPFLDAWFRQPSRPADEHLYPGPLAR